MGSIDSTQLGSLDRILKEKVAGKNPQLHNACFAAIGKEGTLYSAAYGSRDLAQTQPNTLDSLFWIGSLTKLHTAVAVMIAVGRGLVTLDQNVREIVPELAELDVIEGFEEDGTPRLRKCTAPISLRQLLTHTSGFCYDMQQEKLQRWAAYVGKKDCGFSGSYSGYLYPLIFEPGEGWAYSPGMDFAGRVIEILTNQDLETFMRNNIWAPLGMNSTTFRPWTRPDLTENLNQVAHRAVDGSLIKGRVPLGYPAIDCLGGVGLYSTPADQIKLLSALLGDRADIISKEGLDEILRPQLANPAHFLEVVCGSKRIWLGQTWPVGAQGDFGLSASINAEAFPGRRAAMSANWSGMAGIHAWLDRTTGLAGLFVTQILPPGDKPTIDLFLELEAATYQTYGPCVEGN
ncbi:beta-lactamase family protein [Echria macrotheca]|uniref:Beta-lactamase family protein n=1 Tax=Echria macrotheca TaxID=438768 RepID=A0AAJ0B870_9PEZI|nr:beta-lactamase family protein [Echria macrotheca]